MSVAVLIVVTIVAGLTITEIATSIRDARVARWTGKDGIVAQLRVDAERLETQAVKLPADDRLVVKHEAAALRDAADRIRSGRQLVLADVPPSGPAS